MPYNHAVRQVTQAEVEQSIVLTESRTPDEFWTLTAAVPDSGTWRCKCGSVMDSKEDAIAHLEAESPRATGGAD